MDQFVDAGTYAWIVIITFFLIFTAVCVNKTVNCFVCTSFFLRDWDSRIWEWEKATQPFFFSLIATIECIAIVCVAKKQPIYVQFSHYIRPVTNKTVEKIRFEYHSHSIIS